MDVTAIDIASTLGDSVWYQHDEEDPAGPFAADGWWHRASMQHETVEPTSAPDNVVKVVSTGWYEMGLDWPEATPVGANTVVFVNFPKNEK